MVLHHLQTTELDRTEYYPAIAITLLRVRNLLLLDYSLNQVLQKVVSNIP